VARSQAQTRLRLPIGLSALAHASVIALIALVRQQKAPALPPIYRVTMVAAPAGPRAEGVVTETPPAPVPKATPVTPPKRAEVSPSDMPAPAKKGKAARKPLPPATPTIAQKSTPKDAPTKQAGGGPTGGRGTDVANVKTEGMDFPYPGYLTNIVRQIALNFKPRNPGVLKAEVFFLIRRDGSVSGFRFITRSGSVAFDLEAQGAVEAAAQSRAFGRLPDDFNNDFLPVIFSFDPTIIR
jgi:protein TonB